MLRSLIRPAGSLEAGAVFLLLRAPPAGASFDPDPARLPEGPGASAAPRGAQPHPQDCAGVREARWAGTQAAGGPGEKSQTHQELGVFVVFTVKSGEKMWIYS